MTTEKSDTPKPTGEPQPETKTQEEKPKETKPKKCRVCSEPAVTEHTLIFACDIGFK